MRQARLKRVFVAVAAAAALVVAFPLSAHGAAKPKGLVAFTDANFDDIWAMNQDGSGIRNLTNTPGNTIFEYDAAWSSDGKQIAYIRNSAPPDSDAEIWVMNADGSNQHQLTFNSANDGNPSFSPDRKRIAFFSDLSGSGGGQDNELWMMNADGSGQARLTFNTFNDNGPDWSPDGTRIAFQSSRSHPGALGARDIWTMNPDGSDPKQLTAISPAFNATSPHYSPDGKRLAFSGNQDGDSEIYGIPSGGGATTQITNTAGGGTGQDRGPQWTKDGLARIFFVSGRATSDDALFSMNNDGSSVAGPFATTALPGGGSASPAPEPAAKCGKKVATIVGTDAPETLQGGPGPDVIAAFGGKDKVKGLGGKDRICGDKGNDKISGGGGNDRIVGGPGNNKLNGGAGKKNVCIGGKGDNTAKKCQKEKKISS